MPDRTKFRAGDAIRLLAVPMGDLEQRNREVQAGLANAGWTADTIERIIAERPVVTIDRVDECSPWFDVELTGQNGETEYHSLVIMDEDSWEYA